MAGKHIRGLGGSPPDESQHVTSTHGRGSLREEKRPRIDEKPVFSFSALFHWSF